MSKKHLKRLAAPRTWPIQRKTNKWITKPNPSGHSIDKTMPINLILKEILKLTKTTQETKKILNQKEVLINKKPIKNIKFPVSLMDILEIPKINKYYRVLFNKKGKLILHPIEKEEASIKLSKIINKTLLKHKKLQLNLDDGRNILIDKEEYKTGDTIVFDLSKNEIKLHLKLEKDVLIYLTGGKNISKVGTFEKIKEFQGSQKDKIIFKIDKQPLESLKEYAFVIGKDKPIISIP